MYFAGRGRGGSADAGAPMLRAAMYRHEKAATAPGLDMRRPAAAGVSS